MKGDVDYWRGLVAAAAEIHPHVVTQFSPRGFEKALGQPRWWLVQVGPLALCNDGEWRFHHKSDGVRARMKYAWKTAAEALAALRAAVAPVEPSWAEVFESIVTAERERG